MSYQIHNRKINTENDTLSDKNNNQAWHSFSFLFLITKFILETECSPICVVKNNICLAYFLFISRCKFSLKYKLGLCVESLKYRGKWESAQTPLMKQAIIWTSFLFRWKINDFNFDLIKIQHVLLFYFLVMHSLQYRKQRAKPKQRNK